MSWFGNLISGVGNFIGGLFGGNSDNTTAIGSTIAGVASNSTQYGYARSLADQQQEFNRSNMAYSNSLAKDLTDYNYQTTLNSLMSSPGALRQGMESAGFNPILAYSSGNYTNAVSPGNSSALASTMPNAPNVDYINDYTRLKSQMNQDSITNSTVENTNADTTVKKFGQKLAIIKNLKDLYKDKSIPKFVKKEVSSDLLKYNSDLSTSAFDMFSNQHPTTMRILQKLKNRDFKGIKYEIDSRRNRIKNQYSNSGTSSSNQKYDTVYGWYDTNKKYPYKVEYLDY